MTTRSTTPVTRFNAGEVDPAMHGRLDLAQYQASAREAWNLLLLPHGGFRRRGGTRFVAAAKHHDRPARLVPFIYSNADRYAFEFGDRYIRFFYRGGQLRAENVETEIANGDFTDDISGWDDASTDTITEPIDGLPGALFPGRVTRLGISPRVSGGFRWLVASWVGPRTVGNSPLTGYQTRWTVGEGQLAYSIPSSGWSLSINLSTSASIRDPVFRPVVVEVRAVNSSGFGPVATATRSE